MSLYIFMSIFLNVYIYVLYLCVCVCVYICKYKYTCIYAHIFVYVCFYTCIYAYTCVCIYIMQSPIYVNFTINILTIHCKTCLIYQYCTFTCKLHVNINMWFGIVLVFKCNTKYLVGY